MGKLELDLGDGYTQELPLARRNSMSILLGAGFSVPKGYPTGGRVNDALVNFSQFPVYFAESGELVTAGNKEYMPPYKNEYQKTFDLCKRLIVKYAEEYGTFNYEAFYDFIKGGDIYLPRYSELWNDSKDGSNDYRQVVYGIDSIYNQMVAYLIHDKDWNTWYDESPSHIGYVEKYDSFLKVLSLWSKNLIVNVHTLNHDLLFESFRKTDYLSGLISDGFDEFGSNYYGELHKGNARYNVRLERYKGRYNTPIRLFKLHGSLDYVLYRRTTDNAILMPDCYVKIKKYISPGYLMRAKGSKWGYEKYPFAIHADFLTGTKSKINRYNEPLLYKKLFKKFRNNLRTADNLFIIGYGGGDEKINEYILENFDYKTKKVCIFDPKPSEILKEFAATLHTQIIEKSVEELEIKDFG